MSEALIEDLRKTMSRIEELRGAPVAQIWMGQVAHARFRAMAERVCNMVDGVHVAFAPASFGGGIPIFMSRILEARRWQVFRRGRDNELYPAEWGEVAE